MSRQRRNLTLILIDKTLGPLWTNCRAAPGTLANHRGFYTCPIQLLPQHNWGAFVGLYPYQTNLLLQRDPEVNPPRGLIC